MSGAPERGEGAEDPVMVWGQGEEGGGRRKFVLYFTPPISTTYFNLLVHPTR